MSKPSSDINKNFNTNQQSPIKKGGKNKSNETPMKYKGGRFSIERYQDWYHEKKPMREEDLYEIDQAALERARRASDYSSINIEALLLEQGVDYNNPNTSLQWLPLHQYEDNLLDPNPLWLWAEKCPQQARALHRNLDGRFTWQICDVQSYNKESEKFLVHFLVDSSQKELSRIHICFDSEHPQQFVLRVADAHQRRVYADSLIRYKYYVESMPLQEGQEISEKSYQNIANLVLDRKIKSMDPTQLFSEVNKEFAQTMNKIVFDKYLNEANSEMLPSNLVLPPENKQFEVQYKGLLPLEAEKGAKEIYVQGNNFVFEVEPKDFHKCFKEFCVNSLYTKTEVVTALQQIRKECQNALNLQFFETNFKNSLRLEEFKNIQDILYNKTIQFIKVTWINQTTQIIESNFESIDSGYFNLKDHNQTKSYFENGKLNKFLQQVKLQMQVTLDQLCQQSFKQYCEVIKTYLPLETQVNTIDSVYNKFATEDSIKPLFVMDLLPSVDGKQFAFTYPPQNFVNSILYYYNKVLDEIQKVPDIKHKVIVELFRSTNRIDKYIKAPKKPELNDKQNDDYWLNDIYIDLEQQLLKGVEPLDEYIKQYDQFKGILQTNPIEYCKQFDDEEAPKEIAEIQREILDIQNKRVYVEKQIPNYIQISIFQINCKDIQTILVSKYSEIEKLLKLVVAKRAKADMNTLYSQVQDISAKLKITPKDIEEISAVKELMEQIPIELQKMQIEIDKVLDLYAILESYEYKFSAEEMNKRWNVFGGPKSITDLIQAKKDYFLKEETKFFELMKVEQEGFAEKLEMLNKQIQGFSQYDDIDNNPEVNQICLNMSKQLKEYAEAAKIYNSRESLFGVEEITDYSHIAQMNKDFTPYYNLWTTANQWFTLQEKTLNGDFQSIDAPQCEKFVEDSMRVLAVTARFFKDRDMMVINQIAEKVRGSIDEFRPKVPLVVALRKTGMKDRHWEEITQVSGKEVVLDENFTFQKALDLGLMNVCENVCNIGEKAYKEYQIETMLAQMKSQWQDINMQLKPFKSVTSIITGWDEISIVVDEHIVNTQTMQFSPFKKPFEEEIIQWGDQLKLVSDILEEWCKCQGQYMYLQPIFDSADIAKQLPAETKKFKAVDATWKNAIQIAKTQVNAIKVCTSEGLLERLIEANQSLEVVQKELNNYLEKKRERFARFYFLSNDDLLEILSQTKEPTAVQPYLKKVFESIFEIEFDKQKKIHAMFSAEREKINFVQEVNPVGQNVEDWMTEVESQMYASVRFALLESIKDYTNKPRPDWVRQHPGQCVLNGSQAHWTTEVEEAFKDGVPGITKYWTEVLQKQLLDLVFLVRQKLTKQEIVTLNALIVIDVHAKDVVEKLWREEIDDINSFEWISQLRYYWQNDNMQVKCVQTVFPYGYEYLGNTLRLVITPLTDKCYMTLMGALNLNLGGAPAGPAGTGKTESTKDLAKAVAIQCVVFNCSDSMDYIMVAKFFKGLAASGAWCCFDEFNRINVEVLSVIAQQLIILFGAKSEGVPRIDFEGSNIKICPTFCVFITMNPGYAGRTELPDNLKALFRPMAMMVPDYAMIGEIMFYSFGFTLGRELAKKMVATFNLCSCQLSSQDHYDYGMRAVRSVINAGGILKQQDPDMDENQLLLRALRDVNLPKFLKDDLPLFDNIIKDLFPGVERPSIDYSELLKALDNTCKEFNYQTQSVFIEKVLQLYDTIQVRHGLMLVGPTGGGKSCNYKALQHALTSIAAQPSTKMPNIAKVHTHILNPKSIKMGQLYGENNDMTGEWTDGILPYMVRESIRDLPSGQKHWVIFDGPVDAIWIESMNTVLDDNKKLCLNSGQILSLTPHMTMMFEVEDLAVASPATVSRCGMVYMEPLALTTQPIIFSWLNAIPPNILKHKELVPTIQKIIDQYFDKHIFFVRRNLKELVTSIDNNLVASCLKIMTCFMAPWIETEIKKVPMEELDNLVSMIEPMMIFAMIWSFGCTTDYEGRKQFSRHLMLTIATNKSTWKIPSQGLVYDYFFDQSTKKFTLWTEQLKDFNIPSGQQYHEIMVPTPDSQRNIYLMKLLMKNNFHVLTVGPTGTGKSQNSYELLGNQMGETFQYVALTFSAQTGCNQTQDTIDSKMEKRRKGYYGPPIGKKCIIFVDDLNMPKKEEYGAQPPLEILRQYMDYKGWYNRKDMSWMNLEDLVQFAAMGPPGGGRSKITNRLVRHYNQLAYTELDEDSIKSIFINLMNYFFAKFNEEVRQIIPQLIQTVLYVYNTVRLEMLPTPSKSHYTFNLRDISKVFQGICISNSKFCVEKADLLRIWYHESNRVFSDRLINDDDRNYFNNLLKEQIPHYEVQEKDVINEVRVLYADFQDGRDVEPRVYRQCIGMKQLEARINEYQDDYNVENMKKPMNLILFLDACEHICRIHRVLRQPAGNCLLMGVGGSGRQSLSRLATFIAGYKIFQIEVTKSYTMRTWREDIRSCLMVAGVENKPITFLFVDTQIINEQMLEDVNNILNSGDVTGIYGDKEMDEIATACRPECVKKNIQPNKMNIYSQYLVRVKSNIHIILAMSPLGDIFTTRLRMFPSLVNCCTLDWFTDWPEEALLGVGKGQLIDHAANLGIEDQLPQVVEMIKRIHKTVEKKSISYKESLRRYNYVTPKSFLEQLDSFKSILKEKQQKSKFDVQRLKNGLDKLMMANDEVAKMEIELTAKAPLLEQASKETEEMMIIITADKKVADEQQVIVAAEEIIATKQANEAKEIEKVAVEGVRDANEILQAALKEVALLQDSHIVEVKSVNNPAKPVRIILGGLVIMNENLIKQNGGNIIMVASEDPKDQGKKVPDYFATAKLYLLNNPKKLLEILQKYDRDNIPQSYIQKLEKQIIPEPDFTPQRAKDCSIAIKYIFGWINAMYSYNKIFLETKPLREKLEAAQEIVRVKTAELAVKKAQLKEINDKLEKLEKLFNEKVAYKQQLTDDITDCQIKLSRAQKLVVGLSDEKKRWSIDVQNLMKEAENIVGNTLVSAGMIAYSGSFTSEYRKQLEQQWNNDLCELNIKHTNNISMRVFLGVAVKIQQWNICGLPKDDTSTENGIIIEKSRRFPLMIDPQTQANKYIKNLGKERPEGIEVIKMSDSNYMRIIEKAIQFGQWVLLENVLTELDPSLEPILQQEVSKSGGGLVIQFGDKTLNYDEKFKFFMTTTNPNPHYSPETSVKVTLINFAITPSGLEEQMLGYIVASENPQLEQKKFEIVVGNARDAKTLLTIEDSILKSLSEIEDINDMLKDDTMIDQLATSKKFATEINQRVADSRITEKEIDETRESYRPVAFRAQLLFFCIMDLSLIDPMYQYSLQWFVNLFIAGCENSPASNEHHQRLENLNAYFTYSLYENICRSLFEVHKLLFSLLLTNKILQSTGVINSREWRYLLTGTMENIELAKNPVDWIAESSWPNIYKELKGTAILPGFEQLEPHFMSNPDLYKHIYDSADAHREIFPEPFNTSLNAFQKILALKVFRPGKVIPAIQDYIAGKMGKEFIIAPTFDLGKCYKDSAIATPLLFVLSSGSDPVSDFKKIAEEMGMSKRYQQISLGQGQGPKAQKMIQEETQRGGWVLLQNCHLAISWANELERICEELNDNMHKDFRLWLTSMPTPKFPISVLQNSVKMVLEPPKGLRSNMLRTYANLDDKELNDCNKVEAFKKLLFGFSLFHAIIQDRRKFGPIGWNIAYEFTNEDLTCCKKQLKIFLDNYDEIPFKVINYLGSEINYGGRVTDDKDVRLIKNILETYITEGVMTQEKFKYSESGIYYAPEAGSINDYIQYIEAFPLNPAPEAFGLHDNAEITNSVNETRDMLETILSVQPRESSGAGKSRESVIEEIANSIQQKTPAVYIIDDIYAKFPTDYNESMNTVLVQECIRYNRLLEIMKISLINVKKALKGLIVMSEDLDQLATSLFNNVVPGIWEKVGFLSLKPLAAWTVDLLARIQFLNDWFANGTPIQFWYSGFFFPQAFASSCLQNYARKYKIAIDQLSFEYEFLDHMLWSDVKQAPDNGNYIWGMFLEGARWDYEKHYLTQSRPKELFSDWPLMHCIPKQNKIPKKVDNYNCPVYKVVSRKGTLSTTGHSTNFVMFVEVPSNVEEKVWIKAGVAGFLALRY